MSQLFEFQRPVAGSRHFDTSATPSQVPKSHFPTSTHDLYHPSNRTVTSTNYHFDNPSLRQKKNKKKWRIFVVVTNCRNDVSKWRMIEVTCPSDGWLKSRVEVKDFGAWVGVAFVSNDGYSPGAEIFMSIIKKLRHGCFFAYLCSKDSSLPEHFFVSSEKTWDDYQAFGHEGQISNIAEISKIKLLAFKLSSHLRSPYMKNSQKMSNFDLDWR